jgi:hypothetical protein
MEPYRYLEQVSLNLDLVTDRQELNRILDELEFVYEALEPEHQDLASDLIGRINSKLKSMPGT